MNYQTNDLNSSSLNGLIIFYLDDELFCADIDDIFAVINPADYPKNFKNEYLINSHLEIENLTISVIDLHSLFSLKKSKITPTSRFLCMDVNGKSFGFITDKIEELISLNPNTVKEFKLIKSYKDGLLFGKIKHNDEVYSLPNFKKIINESFVHL